MKNRIRHLLQDWTPDSLEPASDETQDDAAPAPGRYTLPRDINMLRPVELCINRDLLTSLLSASIQEIYRHRRAMPANSDAQLVEVEAILRQQLFFRAWVRSHPANYISVALYPVTEGNTADDLDDLDA